ncbi:accessory subunit 2 of queuine tRNA-ribosyltransferase [Chloropicon roscoffensis]|uniref:Queuine tRNA-ribosyltransferase accessory subunit 2 n=1 Tax=Chloropicon roscoffensis TaxID=1461544 RepID=A0AAX4P3C2_9CHLO|mmetsp:Transcript_8103/g.24268  ORF Transcript_8103/g.24268 Transcript_8103/m.24268 type:complete len:411 (-) Transcript_8103:152-1384(-)
MAVPAEKAVISSRRRPQFSLCKEDSKSGARTGCITTWRGATAETPFGLVVTRKGLPSYLTLDNLGKVNGVQGMHVCASHFFGRDALYPREGGSLSEIIGQEDASPLLVLCGLRDPACYNLNLYPAAGREKISVDTEVGVKAVSQQDYIDFVRQAQPDLCLSLSDDVVGSHSKRRRERAQQRTAAWLRDSVKCFGESDGALGSVGLIASVLATEDGEENLRQARSAEALASDPSVVGYAVMGLGLGESEECRKGALQSICGELPREKLRYTSGPNTPLELIEAIECGVDVLDATFVNELTACGMAMAFPADAEGPAVSGTGRGLNLNLWSEEFTHDQGVLVPGCGCYTCQNGFSRGYIHHLLQCRELLAEVLLEFHNTHHMCRFMGTIRAKIDEGVFSEYAKSFRKLYIHQ